MNLGNMNKDVLLKMLREHALKIGSFTLASGRISSCYIDVRAVSMRAMGMAIIGAMIRDFVEDFQPDPPIGVFGGMAMGAAPLVCGAVMMMHGSDTRGFLVRPEEKTHGLGGSIIGPLRKGDTVAILEDVTTSGRSAMNAVLAARSAGCEVACVITVLDRLEGAADLFADQGIPFHALTTINDLEIEP